MQGIRTGIWFAGVLLIAVNRPLQAETLRPDPAWQQGKLENGFRWQILNTPQRASDRIELRLLINTGSLVETHPQTGFSHLLPRLAMVHNVALEPAAQRALWQQGMDPVHRFAPAVVSYNFTRYNLSLPANRPELMRNALLWLAATAGKMTVNEQVIQTAIAADDPVATCPADTHDVWWRYRLNGSSLSGHDPASPARTPVDIASLNAFYHQWYTPDAMTLLVVGNIDSRTLVEQIDTVFSPLTGKRQTPQPVPVLSPLPAQPVTLIDKHIQQDRLSLVWETPWQPIREERELLHYWQSELAREALFWHVQRQLNQDGQMSFDCRVLYQQRSQCAIHINSGNNMLEKNMKRVARELVALRDTGLTAKEFAALLARKNEELNALFAGWARTSTDVLIKQRLRSQQNAVVDIAPEAWQKLRQNFLNQLTLAALNQELQQQLSQPPVMVLLQPQNEPEADINGLSASWQQILAPLPVKETAAEKADASAP